jgi:hypothetical protein
MRHSKALSSTRLLHRLRQANRIASLLRQPTALGVRAGNRNMESASPYHLQCSRIRQRRAANEYTQSYPAIVARFKPVCDRREGKPWEPDGGGSPDAESYCTKLKSLGKPLKINRIINRSVRGRLPGGQAQQWSEQTMQAHVRTPMAELFRACVLSSATSCWKFELGRSFSRSGSAIRPSASLYPRLMASRKYCSASSGWLAANCPAKILSP